MKKTIFIAALACMALASCNKQVDPMVPAVQTPDGQEISVIAFNSMATKGYTAWDGSTQTFQEVVNPSAESFSPSDRTMSLSSFNASKGEDFFVGEEYAKGTDDLWHATPKIYYPLGGDSFNFLAYSVGDDANYIGEWVNANKVTLEVDDKFYQDEILFAAGSAKATAPTVDLVFDHAQAWIHFNICIAGASEVGVGMKINSITWKDIYGKGLLTITGDGTTATAKWNFFNQVPADIAMTSANGLLPGLELDEVETSGTDGAVSKLDMLLPAQNHTNFVINYNLGDQSGLEYEVPVSASSWEMGTRYTYNVKITINEVTAAPTIELFEEEEVTFNI